MGHKLGGVEANYFIGAGAQDRMLEAYMKSLSMLTVFTDKETLQKQYDSLKQKYESDAGLKRIESLEKAILSSRSDMLRLIREELGLSPDKVPDHLKIMAMRLD